MFARQDQANRRAGARGLTRDHHKAPARRLGRIAAGALCAAAVGAPLAGVAAAQAATSAATPYTFAGLKLQNGWFNYGYGTAGPAVTNISGIVHLKGDIATHGTNSEPFVLPVGDRPATKVYVPVDLSGDAVGRLFILPSGVVEVVAANWSSAQTGVSLDGAAFATSGSSFTKLTLINGWKNYSTTTASPEVRNINGIVHFRGAIKTNGLNGRPFTLPAAFRPAHEVFVAVDLCDTTPGDLAILPTGQVRVRAGGGNWGNAQCFTSLEGASFARSATSFTPLALKNGWHNYGFGTAKAAVRKISGIVHFEGAIASSGTNPLAFTLPVGFRPSHIVILPVDLNNANNGRLVISPSGTVTVFTQLSWINPGLFTSLDGLSFAP